MSIAEVVGSYLKPESRICSDGIGAVMYGWSRIADGQYRLALITAHCKESEGNLSDIESAALDPFTQRRLGANADAIAAMSARRLFAAGTLNEAEAAALVVAARESGRKNDKVEDLPAVTLDEVLSADPLATPLRSLDRAPATDASCAIVIAAEDVAGELSDNPVWITGLGTGTGRYWSDRDPEDLSALELARSSAERMAGWSAADADLFEVGGQYSFELAHYAKTIGADLDAAGATLNSSGGRHAGSPVTVAGLDGVIELVHQLRGTAGARQVAGPEKALAHGVAGVGSQTHWVAALEGPGP